MLSIVSLATSDWPTYPRSPTLTVETSGIIVGGPIDCSGDFVIRGYGCSLCAVRIRRVKTGVTQAMRVLELNLKE